MTKMAHQISKSSDCLFNSRFQDRAGFSELSSFVLTNLALLSVDALLSRLLAAST